jgi:glyoxylase-like metal-dependent hydrolase (beta-lactamase superfamily II)
MSNIHPIEVDFEVQISESIRLPRKVRLYLITGDQTALIDAGVSGNHDAIVAALAGLGKKPQDIDLLINTHAHPDHIGGNKLFKDRFGTKFAFHVGAARWIQNVPLQAKERPIMGIETMIAGSVQADRYLENGDVIDLGGLTLHVIHTPGHGPGQVSLYCPEEKTLLTGDTIPPTMGLPLYYDCSLLRWSLRKLLQVEDVEILHDSHVMAPFVGADAARAALQAGLDYMDRVEAIVAAALAELGRDASLAELTAETLRNLGFEKPPVLPLTMETVNSHLAQMGLLG